LIYLQHAECAVVQAPRRIKRSDGFELRLIHEDFARRACASVRVFIDHRRGFDRDLRWVGPVYAEAALEKTTAATASAQVMGFNMKDTPEEKATPQNVLRLHSTLKM